MRECQRKETGAMLYTQVCDCAGGGVGWVVQPTNSVNVGDNFLL